MLKLYILLVDSVFGELIPLNRPNDAKGTYYMTVWYAQLLFSDRWECAMGNVESIQVFGSELICRPGEGFILLHGASAGLIV